MTRAQVATILNISVALVRSGWDGAPLNRSFYPVAALSVAALLSDARSLLASGLHSSKSFSNNRVDRALLVLETRADVVYPAVYCWAVGAIVVRRKTAAARGFCCIVVERSGPFPPIASAITRGP